MNNIERSKQMNNIERFKQEIAPMKMVDHPYIIRLYDTFEDRRNIYLIMELCSGGELFDRVIEPGHFSEVQAKNIMQQLVPAICLTRINTYEVMQEEPF